MKYGDTEELKELQNKTQPLPKHIFDITNNDSATSFENSKVKDERISEDSNKKRN